MPRPPSRIDPFVLMILAAAGLAFLLPATGGAAVAVDWATRVAVFILFFGYGAKLSVHEAVAGLRHWRLHLVILACTFVVFPLVGAGFLAIPDGVIGVTTRLGLAFLCLVPSTVQSSITFTSLAGGNVPGAMVSATASNLLGVLVTPMLALLMLPANGGSGIGLDQFLGVVVQLLLPFVLGQLSRRWTAGFMSTHSRRIKYWDQGVICLVVYGAFSDFFAQGMWRQVEPWDLLVMVALCLALLAAMLWFTWHLGGWLNFTHPDRIAIMFCGTKKSLATGVPMASVLFADQSVGLVVLPLMVFHQLQLMACTVIAGRLARGTGETAGARPPGT
ncbi:bile acid:sodium symporter [Tessaracoccus sp. OS52]|uniref:bile acid:sodium symporter family protein n=1 Tax=Tessaracoccus sp. OS52 TaxID=2886691 RepID=UPI001D10CE47|nr:bile acid:sodium symporter family protein [Tessaracoccus sp. OS52]MCC2593318.1 bile acid:sodium symporter [Tessaracoccus sp. OS52]